MYRERLEGHQEKLNIIQKKIDSLRKIMNHQKINGHEEINTLVFKKYVELNDVTKTTAYINSCGYRIPTNTYVGERKYKTNDITAILKEGNRFVEDELVEAVELIKELDKLFFKINIATGGGTRQGTRRSIHTKD